MLKTLLNKVVSWAGHKYAIYYLSFLCFIESIFFPIPPDVMLIPMALAKIQKWFKIATVALLSTLTGAIVGYIIGYFFYKEVVPLIARKQYHSQNHLKFCREAQKERYKPTEQYYK